MAEESDHDKVIRLEERLQAAADALKLAYANQHGMRAEAFSLSAIIMNAITIYIMLKK